jgi:hypothetical protein
MNAIECKLQLQAISQSFRIFQTLLDDSIEASLDISFNKRESMFVFYSE